MSYKLAIFDLDGTILDTLEDLTDSVNYALIKNAMPPRTVEEIRSFVGNGARLLIERAVLTGSPSDTANKVLGDYHEYYATHSDIKTRPYPGIIDMLTNLRAAGCMTAVLSNKPDAPAKVLCERYFPGLFHIACGEKEGVPRKPAPNGVTYILEQLSISPKDAVYIGDSDVDIETAKNAGLDCISVDWGFRDAEFLRGHGAKNTVSTASALEKQILE